jgi:hypothetical protein
MGDPRLEDDVLIKRRLKGERDLMPSLSTATRLRVLGDEDAAKDAAAGCGRGDLQ